MSKIQELIIDYLDSNQDGEKYRKIIREIQSCDTVWSAFSPITKNHFVDYVQGRPTAFIFSEKNYCEQFCRHMKESGMTVGIAECAKDSRLQMLADYHRSGFECVIIDNGKRYIVMELTDLINIPDYSDKPIENRPVINPDLVCSADRFFQCLENKSVSPDKELNLLVDTYHARFLIPVTGKPEGNSVEIPGLERNDGVKVVPFFTDINEFRKFDSSNKYHIMTAAFEQINDLCSNGETVVINPLGFNFTIVKDTCEGILKAKDAVPENYKESRAVVFTPEKVPKILIDGVCEIMDKIPEVVGGYIKGMRNTSGEKLLIIIDCGNTDEERTKEIVSTVKNQGSEFEEGTGVEYIAANTGIGQTAMAGANPFFQRVSVNFEETEEISFEAICDEE